MNVRYVVFVDRFGVVVVRRSSANNMHSTSGKTRRSLRARTARSGLDILAQMVNGGDGWRS